MESASSRSALGRDVLVSTAGLLVTRGLAAAGGVFVARLLGPALRGDYALIVLVVAVVGTTATFGSEYWVTSALARGQDEGAVRAVIRRQTRRGCVLISVVGVFLLAGFQAVGGVASAVVVMASVAFAVANVVSMLALAVLGGYRRMVRVATAQVAGASSYALMVGGLLIADRASLEYVVVAAMLSTLVLAAVARTRPSSTLPSVKAADYREASRLGVPAMAGELANLAVTRLDLFVVAFLLRPGDVGRYAVATSLAEMLWIVPHGATQVLLPQVARYSRGHATAPLALVSAAVTLVGALVLTIAGPTIVQGLFGRSFTPAANALPWLSVGVAALGAGKLLLADLAARGNTAIRARVALIAAPVMIGGDFALIPVWGIGGAGAASLIAYVLALGLTVRAWRVASGQSLRDLIDVASASRLVGRSVVSLLRRDGAIDQHDQTPSAQLFEPDGPTPPPARGATEY